MDKLLLKSFSKINIGLKIVNRRPDGYHNIHTIFQELDFHDIIVLKKRNLNIDMSPAFFVEEIRKNLIDKYGEKKIYKQGFYIKTSLDKKIQKVATSALNQNLMKSKVRCPHSISLTCLAQEFGLVLLQLLKSLFPSSLFFCLANK